jgi:hypothetical protein
MKMALGTLLCAEHSFEAFPAIQKVEIVVGVHVGQAAECLNYNAMSLREHDRLSVGKLNIENAFAILCTEHPNHRWWLLRLLQREADPKGKPTCLAKSERD